MRGRMMHVVNNLSAFLMFEVMESAWLTLQDAVHRACCLDDVIRAHDAYLGEIMDRALLAPQHESINMQVIIFFPHFACVFCIFFSPSYRRDLYFASTLARFLTYGLAYSHSLTH